MAKMCTAIESIQITNDRDYVYAGTNLHHIYFSKCDSISNKRKVNDTR